MWWVFEKHIWSHKKSSLTDPLRCWCFWTIGSSLLQGMSVIFATKSWNFHYKIRGCTVDYHTIYQGTVSWSHYFSFSKVRSQKITETQVAPAKIYPAKDSSIIDNVICETSKKEHCSVNAVPQQVNFPQPVSAPQQDNASSFFEAQKIIKVVNRPKKHFFTPYSVLRRGTIFKCPYRTNDQ